MAQSGDIPQGGIVSITFDDGYQSAYEKALPTLDAHGYKATWYIISGKVGSKSYMTQSELFDLQASGQEMGGHTRTHPSLDTLSDPLASAEIAGGRQDLLKMGFKPVSNFAYPYGKYNGTTPDLAKEAGFTSARTTNEASQNSKFVNTFLLNALPATSTTSFAKLSQAADKALRDGTWLIYCFHRVDEDGNPISVRHELLDSLFDYLTERRVPVVTVTEGLQWLAK